MLKQIRREKNLTQVELAEAIGCNQGQIANWEAGRHPIPENYRIELQKVLCCHIPPAVPKAKGRKRKNYDNGLMTTSFHLTETQWLTLKKKARDAGVSMVQYLIRELELGE